MVKWFHFLKRAKLRWLVDLIGVQAIPAARFDPEASEQQTRFPVQQWLFDVPKDLRAYLLRSSIRFQKVFLKQWNLILFDFAIDLLNL
jgi:hypothetical protein